jgi:hypothetical protein
VDHVKKGDEVLVWPRSLPQYSGHSHDHDSHIIPHMTNQTATAATKVDVKRKKQTSPCSSSFNNRRPGSSSSSVTSVNQERKFTYGEYLSLGYSCSGSSTTATAAATRPLSSAGRTTATNNGTTSTTLVEDDGRVSIHQRAWDSSSSGKVVRPSVIMRPWQLPTTSNISLPTTPNMANKKTQQQSSLPSSSSSSSSPRQWVLPQGSASPRPRPVTSSPHTVMSSLHHHHHHHHRFRLQNAHQKASNIM